MGRKLFNSLSSPVLSNNLMPWWRALSPSGWMMVVGAIYSTANVIAGLVVGEIMLFIPSRHASGLYFFKPETHPKLFWTCMAAYAFLAACLWALLIHTSVKRRRRQLERLAARRVEDVW
jgi:hypothetical protein